MRAEGEIGAALEASVTVYASEKVKQALAKTGDELRFVFITSQASLADLSDKPDGLETISSDGLEFAIQASKATGEKCVRCWHLRDDVGSHKEHTDVCDRCISNVHGSGETRRIA